MFFNIYIFLKCVYLFIFGCAGSSLLLELVSSCEEWGLLSICGGFSCCRAWAPGHVGSVVVASGLQSTGTVVEVHRFTCSVAYSFFPDQGLNPCLLHWQVDSLPLSCQGGPQPFFFFFRTGAIICGLAISKGNYLFRAVVIQKTNLPVMYFFYPFR